MSLKHKVEAILFSTGKKTLIGDIAKLCKSSTDNVSAALEELKEDYLKRNSSLLIVDDGPYWKIVVREEHMPLVRNIVTSTELSKTVTETLAIIAWKSPVKQSEVIRMRTNKAYDHLRELEEAGYIVREKYSRTKLIKLTPKFFEYFDLPEEKVKEQFKDFNQIAAAISEKEAEAKRIRAEQRKRAEEAGKEGKKHGSDVGSGLQKLKVYDSKKEEEEQKTVLEEEKIGGLDIVDTEPEKEEPVAEEVEEGLVFDDSGEEPAEETPDTKEPISEEESGGENPAEKEDAHEEESDVEKEEPKEDIAEAESDRENSPTEEHEGEEPEGDKSFDEEPEQEEDDESLPKDEESKKRAYEIMHPKENEEVPPDVEKRFEEIVHPQEKKEEDEENKESEKKKGEREEEPEQDNEPPSEEE